MTSKEALKQLCDNCVYNKYIVNYIPSLKQCKAISLKDELGLIKLKELRKVCK